VNRLFLVRIEQPGRVSYLAVQGHLNALHLGQAYARQAPTQQILVLDAVGRVLWKAVPRADLQATGAGVRQLEPAGAVACASRGMAAAPE
jgi:hypothetical protein